MPSGRPPLLGMPTALCSPVWPPPLCVRVYVVGASSLLSDSELQGSPDLEPNPGVGQAGGVGVCVSSGGIPPLSLTQAARLPEPTWHVSGMGGHMRQV